MFLMKVVASVFEDAKRIPMVNYLVNDQTVTKYLYANLFRQKIKKNWYRTLDIGGGVFRQDKEIFKKWGSYFN